MTIYNCDLHYHSPYAAACAKNITIEVLAREAKKKGIGVIVISHRPSVLSEVDKIMVLQDGAVASFGSKEEVQGRIKMLQNGMIHINEQ